MTMRNHHIAPQELMLGGSDPHGVFQALAQAGIDINNNSPAWNLQALPIEEGYVWQSHNGSHGGYTDWYSKQLDRLDNLYSNNPRGTSAFSRFVQQSC